MSVDLSQYVPSLRREVTPPGSTLFASVNDTVFVGYLSDAFWEARLDGFLEGWSCDTEGEVTPVDAGGQEFPRENVALLTLYAGIRVLRNQIMNMRTSLHAKAGPVEFEQQNSASVLAELLKQLRETKKRLLEMSEQNATLTSIFDALSTREWVPASYFGSPELI